MKSYIQESRKIISDFSGLLFEAPLIYEELYKSIGHCDRQVADITHDIEFLDFDKEKGYKKLMELKKNRKTRRKNKEIMEFVKILKNFGENHTKLVDELNDLLKQYDSIIKEQSERVYTPKENKNAMSGHRHFTSEVDRQIETKGDD